MTKEQKEKLSRLRFSGKSYADISILMNMKESTIRTYCCRNLLTDKDIKKSKEKLQNNNSCLMCGTKLVKIPKQKPKKFCSDKCRMEWWSKHRDEMICKANYIIKCKNCGKEFVSYGNKNRKYCCRECYFSYKNADRQQTL